ncbi:hypothetical protein F4808DRAFT_425598 [Astrocystis sublimbata]|nr:hypothetical protein F4808DRAFT_425598 [Astrocystis sublimbata]
MATVESSPKAIHSPPAGNPRRPKGILKNSYQKSPPESPIQEKDLSEKELTIINTQTNAGHRRSSSTASRPAGSRRRSSRTPSQVGDNEDALGSQRLQWDEANLYLTEQERTSTMKITEPKTPYAKHYDPAEDSDDEMADGEQIPGFSLGEPEEEVPQNEFGAGKGRKPSKVHVNDDDATPHHDAENEFLGMTPEEREKHRKFEQLRKKHYEMSSVAKFLGHPEDLEALEEDGDSAPPPVPLIDGTKVKADELS